MRPSRRRLLLSGIARQPGHPYTHSTFEHLTTTNNNKPPHTLHHPCCSFLSTFLSIASVPFCRSSLVRQCSTCPRSHIPSTHDGTLGRSEAPVSVSVRRNIQVYLEVSAIHRGNIAVGVSPLHSSLYETLQPVEALFACNCYCSRFQPWASPVSCPVLASSASRALCTYLPTAVEGQAAPVQRKSSKCRSLPRVIHLLRLSFTENLASLS